MRISATERVRIGNRAEEALAKYSKPDPATGLRPHALWHKHVHNVDLDPMQVLRMIEMDEHRNTVDYSCRRTRKTSTKELFNLERLATNGFLELGIVAPRERQAQNNMKYMVDSIRRSPMLTGYLQYRAGRRQLSDTKFEFMNSSKAQTYGIMGEIDGDSLAIASLEEVDDMPQDRLLSKFLPMLGAAERLGSDVKIDPEIRISGVFKGAGVLKSLLATGEYHTLPPVDVYMGCELGIISQSWVDTMRAQQTEGEWLRQFLCLDIASQNFIWERWIRKAKGVGLEAHLPISEPLPGLRYRRRGLISFGYDHTGHGEKPEASKSCLVVCEQIGSFVTFPFIRYWPAGTDEKVIERDLIGYWDYFRPDYAMGDAYGIGMLTSLNDQLFRRGLTEIDRQTIGEGQSTASTWSEWAFAPIRFEGMVKHSMATTLRAAFYNSQAAIPYFDDEDLHAEAFITFVRQLGNIKTEPTKSSYSSYVMADQKIGDDGFDAACAGVWALVTRGEGDVPTVITSRTQTRSQLLGEPARLPATVEPG